ncbi:2-hydroxyacid dehydrogenase [Actinophytocola gossypii]|uniref:2-hydroxyacid dehydrogenase n=1 Tax=Actinophytocola gossypii TaxID=2812003 RepID=A0ABT2J1N7_9PSEU|nr:2-hydroxyacid dehydrogenase [Actinophytocola gossypii]MCT2581773.1 2-hydroxyacid dehydrogenase [Actinophytocola gossypii]
MTKNVDPGEAKPILVAGDLFVRSAVLVDALRAQIGTAADISTMELPWPVEPFRSIGEVDEASGDEDEVIAALAGVRICVTQFAPLTERVLAACPDLELFCVGRGGPVNVNLEAARRYGVTVTNAPGRNAEATAEHTIAMILAAARRIPDTHGELRGGVWRGDYYRYEQVGIELSGATVGLVGYGAIGHRVAAILAGFGARVLVHDPYLPAGQDVESVALPELLRRSQVVSLHARLTADNRGLIGAKEIALMPTGSILVNCARGGLLDYDAACDALDSGHLFAVAADVFPAEPVPPDARLLHTPGFVVTPHLAGASRQTAHNAANTVAADVARFLRGEPVANPV